MGAFVAEHRAGLCFILKACSSRRRGRSGRKKWQEKQEKRMVTKKQTRIRLIWKGSFHVSQETGLRASTRSQPLTRAGKVRRAEARTSSYLSNFVLFFIGFIGFLMKYIRDLFSFYF
jgi:hypothetical protein